MGITKVEINIFFVCSNRLFIKLSTLLLWTVYFVEPMMHLTHFIIISLIIAGVSGFIDYDSLYIDIGGPLPKLRCHEIEVRKYGICKYCALCV